MFEVNFNNGLEANLTSIDSVKMWHYRFGYLNLNSLKWCFENELFGKKFSVKDTEFCVPCVLGKKERLSHRSSNSVSTRPLILIHSDVCMSTSGYTYDGYRYFLTFLDDYTNFTCVFLLRSKDEISDKFKQFVNESISHYNLPIRIVCYDNEIEYLNQKVRNKDNPQSMVKLKN